MTAGAAGGLGAAGFAGAAGATAGFGGAAGGTAGFGVSGPDSGGVGLTSSLIPSNLDLKLTIITPENQVSNSGTAASGVLLHAADANAKP